MFKKILCFAFLFLTLISVVNAAVNFPITIADDKTINIAFVDEDGDDFDVSSYTFQAYLKDNRTDTDANAAVTIPTSSFTVSGNDASFTLSSANNTRSEGVDYLDVRMFDGSGNRTKVFFAKVSYILSESGNSTALTTTVGSTDLTVTITHASGQVAVANVMTAKGDLLAGSASGAYVIVPAGTNGQFLKADSTVTAGVTWATASGAGDMLQATYDPAGIAEQLAGLTASQTLANKELTTPTISSFVNATHDHSDNAGGGTIAHTDLTSIGTNTHVQIDTHIASSNIHFTEAAIDHTAITNIGSNSHAAIDTHIASSNIHFLQSAISITESQVSDLDHVDSVHRALTNNPHSVDETDILPSQTGNTGKYLTTNGSASSWAAVAGGFTSFTVTGNSGTSQEISDGNTLSILGGTGITAVVGATDTVTLNTVDAEIDHDSLLNFASNEHFTEASIDHANIQSIGTNSHTAIDTHIASSNIHFLQSAISITESQVSDLDHVDSVHRALTNNPHSVDETDILPDQSGNSGKYLTTNGSSSSWAAPGDVVGPGSSTDHAIVRWNSITGTSVLDSNVTVDDSGSINVPSGQAYKINGTAITATTETLTNKTLTQPVITLKQGSAPSNTAEGTIEWDTDDDIICIGDGTNTRKFSDEQFLIVAASDETTDLTTGTAKVTFRFPPYACTLIEVGANVITAPVGSTITVDVNEGGTTVLSTKITIDASEKTSETAATPPVISDSSIATDAEMTIDIDQIGSSTAGKGLKVWFRYRRT